MKQNKFINKFFGTLNVVTGTILLIGIIHGARLLKYYELIVSIQDYIMWFGIIFVFTYFAVDNIHEGIIKMIGLNYEAKR